MSRSQLICDSNRERGRFQSILCSAVCHALCNSECKKTHVSIRFWVVDILGFKGIVQTKMLILSLAIDLQTCITYFCESQKEKCIRMFTLLFSIQCKSMMTGAIHLWEMTMLSYVTLDHKTSHTGPFSFNWVLYIIWKLNKWAFRWCMVCQDRTIYGRDTTFEYLESEGAKQIKTLRKLPLKLFKWTLTYQKISF